MKAIDFFATPIVVGTSTPKETNASVRGALSGGGKNPYVITTKYRVEIIVKNSKDSKVIALLDPLVGTAVEVDGTHAYASREFTVTSVNGAKVEPETMATSTPPNTP